jgi:twitching motility two-component system response regulator PilG
MSHDQLIRHAVDAARAGNPALARVHLQKAAETAPDDPTVWLWLSWLADSPVSMIQCLELVRRHDDYREIAESGLAFARGLARFDCDTVRAPSALAEDDGDAVREVAAHEDPPIVTVEGEHAEDFADSEMEETLEVESVVNEADEETSETVDSYSEDESIDEAEAGEADEEECDAEARDALMAELEAVAAEALGSADEELSPETQARWDGIDLLARTADAVADELKADSITDDVDETLSFPEDEFDLPAGAESLGGIEETSNDSDSDSEMAVHEAVSHETPTDPPSTEEGGSWFDYWLPKEQRATGSTSDSEEEVSSEAIEPDELVSELSETAEAAPHQEPAQNPPQTAAVPVIDPAAPVLELVDVSPLDIEASGSDEEDSESPVDESPDDFSIVVEVAETEAESPSPVPPPLPAEPVSPRPIPVREPANAWRAARTDWFSADSQAPSALVPHEAVATPPALPPFATTAASPGAMIPPPAQGTSQGATVPAGLTAPRPADRSMFDAEPTPPALIDPAGRGSIAGSGPVPTGAEFRTQFSETGDLPNSFEEEPAEGSEGSSSRPRQKLDSSSRRTVLVVDDSPTVRKLVEMSLTRSGFRVVHAFDGVAAIKEIARQNPSLILMDASMPRLDGYQLCKLVKKHETTRHIPVVMLTGKEGVFDKLRGKLVGCSGYIAKPFSPEELETAVGRFLKEPVAL